MSGEEFPDLHDGLEDPEYARRAFEPDLKGAVSRENGVLDWRQEAGFYTEATYNCLRGMCLSEHAICQGFMRTRDDDTAAAGEHYIDQA